MHNFGAKTVERKCPIGNIRLDLGNVRVEQCDLRAGKIKNITDNNRSFTYNFTLNFLAPGAHQFDGLLLALKS